MSEIHEREKAKHLFRQFLHELDAFPPACTGPNEPDSRVEEFVTVSKADAIDCFVRKNPSGERFRDDLSEVRQGEDNFTFKTALWNRLCKE
jgi:hypothetical protein